MTYSSNHWSAVQDFHLARRRAALEEAMARLTGRSSALLPFEEVRRKLGATEHSAETLREIPLEAIVGSVGRYTDFTRSFLPRNDSDAERWARVKMAAENATGLPPIEAYQIGETYFVKDGNHRVSVARLMGVTHIQAYVTTVHSKVPLSPAESMEDLILKSEYAAFLRSTRLDQLRPAANLTVTALGQYQILAEHIAVHRHFMGLEQRREIPYAEAAAHWYDTVYMPVVEPLRDRAILRDFPHRTEADLYLWLSEHRVALQQNLGWEISPEIAASNLADDHSPRPKRVMGRVAEKMRRVFQPEKLEGGPPPGDWRRKHLAAHRHDRLFTEILVALSGEKSGWLALEQALLIARQEQGRLFGLTVGSPDRPLSAAARAIEERFTQRCAAAGVPGQWATESGEVAATICRRAYWADLVIVPLNYPPESSPSARLASGFHTLVQRCPRPILALPGQVSPLDRILLAFDGSAKAGEALCVATYLGACHKAAVTVLTAEEGTRSETATISYARQYLKKHGVAAHYVQASGPAAPSILATAAESECNLILMGGYGASPILEIFMGSSVNQVLWDCRWPVLICR